MDKLEEQFIAAHQALHAATKQASEIKKALIEAYIALHYPDISCQVTIMQENLLSLDVVFPGLGRDNSRRLSLEISSYLQNLIGEAFLYSEDFL